MPEKGKRRHPIVRVMAKRAVERAVDIEAKRADHRTFGSDFPITTSMMSYSFDEWLEVVAAQRVA